MVVVLVVVFVDSYRVYLAIRLFLASIRAVRIASSLLGLRLVVLGRWDVSLEITR